jgi:hypothetical protein
MANWFKKWRVTIVAVIVAAAATALQIAGALPMMAWKVIAEVAGCFVAYDCLQKTPYKERTKLVLLLLAIILAVVDCFMW